MLSSRYSQVILALPSSAVLQYPTRLYESYPPAIASGSTPASAVTVFVPLL